MLPLVFQSCTPASYRVLGNMDAGAGDGNMDAGAGDGTDATCIQDAGAGDGNMDAGAGDGTDATCNQDAGAGDDTWTVVQRKRGKGNVTGRGVRG